MSLVSIITPCFNTEKHLEETFDCLKAQTHWDWEWIVVDDCSTDNSWEILEKFQDIDPRVRIFKNSENSGAAVTRNNSLNKASGEYIAFLDCDDLWMNTKLETQLKFMQENQVDFSYHDYQMVDARGSFIKTMKVPKSTTAKSILKYNPFATSSIMMKRELVEANSIRFKEHLRRRQDYIFWHECLEKVPSAKSINQTLSSYRLSGDDSLSANKKNMAKIQWKLLQTEFNLSPFMASYYFCFYAIHGIKKYFLK